MGDWVADTAVARAGEPGMGVASCFGSPLLNDVLGLSVALIVRNDLSFTSIIIMNNYIYTCILLFIIYITMLFVFRQRLVFMTKGSHSQFAFKAESM